MLANDCIHPCPSPAQMLQGGLLRGSSDSVASAFSASGVQHSPQHQQQPLQQQEYQEGDLEGLFRRLSSVSESNEVLLAPSTKGQQQQQQQQRSVQHQQHQGEQDQQCHMTVVHEGMDATSTAGEGESPLELVVWLPVFPAAHSSKQSMHPCSRKPPRPSPAGLITYALSQPDCSSYLLRVPPCTTDQHPAVRGSSPVSSSGLNIMCTALGVVVAARKITAMAQQQQQQQQQPEQQAQQPLELAFAPLPNRGPSNSPSSRPGSPPSPASPSSVGVDLHLYCTHVPAHLAQLPAVQALHCQPHHSSSPALLALHLAEAVAAGLGPVDLFFGGKETGVALQVRRATSS